MNPRQAPGGHPTGQPQVPPDQNSAYIPDVADAAFGFDDEKPLDNPYKPATVPAAPVPRPALAPQPPRQNTFSPAARATVTVTPPTPHRPPQPIIEPTAAPMPADVMPPQQVPVVPTLSAAAMYTKPLPASVATTATHVPDDITARIATTPMQNSSDIQKGFKNKTSLERFKGIGSFLGFAGAIVLAAFLINQFIFQSYYVEGTSMTPTLQNNDRLIISKVERTFANIQGKTYIPDRGQIIVLDSSILALNGQKEQLIKRVIGLPGDKIHIENGVVTLTNAQYPSGVDITRTLGLTNLQPTFSDVIVDTTIAKDQVYVMGDNRIEGGSRDSRSFGAIDGGKIQGRLWARIIPFDQAELF